MSNIEEEITPAEEEILRDALEKTRLAEKFAELKAVIEGEDVAAADRDPWAIPRDPRIRAVIHVASPKEDTMISLLLILNHRPDFDRYHNRPRSVDVVAAGVTLGGNVQIESQTKYSLRLTNSPRVMRTLLDRASKHLCNFPVYALNPAVMPEVWEEIDPVEIDCPSTPPPGGSRYQVYYQNWI